jgi:hypothetical protein
MLSGTVLSSTLFGTSHASIPKRPPEVDPNTLVNTGVRCYSGGIGCVNTIKIINKIYPKRVETRTSSTAILSESAIIGSNCYIGNYTVIGKDCDTVINESCYGTKMQDRQ